VIKRRDTPKSLTQQGKFKTYPVAMSGVLGSVQPILFVMHADAQRVTGGKGVRPAAPYRGPYSGDHQRCAKWTLWQLSISCR